MAKKSLNFYLVKTVRFSGWVLFFVVMLYLTTGYAQCGKLGFGKLMSAQTAKVIHKSFDLPLVVLFLVHSLIGIYQALRRWGWIRKRATD